MSLVTRCLSIVTLLVVPGLSVSAPSDPSVQHIDSKKIYQKFCSVCHGDKGDGDTRAAGGLSPKPRNFTTEEAAKVLNRQRMIESVAQGRPGTAMVGHSKKLSPLQIEAVVDYIRSTFMKVPSSVTTDKATSSGTQGSGAPAQAQTEVATDMKAAMPKGLKGNSQAGQAFYMKNCFTCHGVNGDGNGPRAYFNTPRPRNFTSDQSRQSYNRPRLFDAISNGKRGTVMPAWGKVLSDQQIADVAEFVFQGFIRGTLKIVVPSELAEETKKKDQ